MKYYYAYKTFVDIAKGIAAKVLLSIGGLLHNGPMMDKGIAIGEQLIRKYTSDICGEVRGRISLCFMGFIYEKDRV